MTMTVAVIIATAAAAAMAPTKTFLWQAGFGRVFYLAISPGPGHVLPGICCQSTEAISSRIN